MAGFWCAAPTVRQLNCSYCRGSKACGNGRTTRAQRVKINGKCLDPERTQCRAQRERSGAGSTELLTSASTLLWLNWRLPLRRLPRDGASQIAEPPLDVRRADLTLAARLGHGVCEVRWAADATCLQRPAVQRAAVTGAQTTGAQTREGKLAGAERTNSSRPTTAQCD